MILANCVRCGKLFQKVASPICEDCKKEEEELFLSVRNYLKENPDKTALEVSEATGVSVRRILRYLEEGRIETTTGLKGELRCDNCGDPIEKGRYCDSCTTKMQTEVDKMIREKESENSKNNIRMHTYEMRKKREHNNK